MSESQNAPGTGGVWSKLWNWIKIMDEAMDTSDTEILERRVKALEFAVAELERGTKARGAGNIAPGW